MSKGEAKHATKGNRLSKLSFSEALTRLGEPTHRHLFYGWNKDQSEVQTSKLSHFKIVRHAQKGQSFHLS